MDFDVTKPVPETQPWSEKFWEGTKEGKLLIQICKDCNARIFYPRKVCPKCWSANLDWIEASGKATIRISARDAEGISDEELRGLLAGALEP